MYHYSGIEGEVIVLWGEGDAYKSIAHAMPIFAMMVFKIPKKNSKESRMLLWGIGGGDEQDKRGCTR